MRAWYPASVTLFMTLSACGGGTLQQGATPRLRQPDVSQSMVGRWALVSLVRNGEDMTDRMRSAGVVSYYTFDADGTFRIVRGDSITETGTWSEDTTVSPKLFDHIPHVNGKTGPYVPGIFAIAGDTLTISLIGPNPERRHPTQFRSVLADHSWLLVYRRAPQ